mgnify:CR=1 FL=1
MMHEDLKDKIRQTILSVMDIDILSLNEDSKFKDIANWDSFNNLMLISRFQDELKIEFTALEIEKTQKLKDLYSLIESKLVKSKISSAK